MKHIFFPKGLSLFWVLFITVQGASAQKTELAINAYTGLFSFRGNGATSTSWMTLYTPNTPGNFTINPYGNICSFSYGFELQAQRITSSKNIYGVGAGFELLNSKVNIDTINGGDLIYFQEAAAGKTILRNSFMTIHPFIGHRYRYHNSSFDLTAGLDVAFCLKSRELGQVTTNNKDYINVRNDKSKPSIDFRPRIQLKAQIKKFGFLAGYSLGLTNYQKQNDQPVYSSVWRAGLSYTIL